MTDPVDAITRYNQHQAAARRSGHQHSKLGLGLMAGALAHMAYQEHRNTRAQLDYLVQAVNGMPAHPPHPQRADAADPAIASIPSWRPNVRATHKMLTYLHQHEAAVWASLPRKEQATIEEPTAPLKSATRGLVNAAKAKPDGDTAAELGKQHSRAWLLTRWNDPSGIIRHLLEPDVTEVHRDLAISHARVVSQWRNLSFPERFTTPRPVAPTLEHAWALTRFYLEHPASAATRGTLYLRSEGITWFE